MQHTILVTGGAGFIGSHLVPQLIAKGYAVRVFDSFVSGKRDRIPAGVELIEGDVRDREALAGAMQGVHAVVHLAAIVSVPETLNQPLQTHDVNVTGSLNVFEAARAHSVAHVVYASSAAVYGNEPTLPKTEVSALDPRSPYALSKMQNEGDAKLYGEVYGLPSIGLRFFNIYGPGQDASHPYASVIPRWIASLKEGNNPEVYGDGLHTRDFVHVRDVAGAIVQALSVTVAKPEVINIATGTQRSLQDVFALLVEKFPGAQLLHKPAREGDVVHSVADISKARALLGFSPTVAFEDGVNELLA